MGERERGEEIERDSHLPLTTVCMLEPCYLSLEVTAGVGLNFSKPARGSAAALCSRVLGIFQTKYWCFIRIATSLCKLQNCSILYLKISQQQTFWNLIPTQPCFTESSKDILGHCIFFLIANIFLQIILRSYCFIYGSSMA